MKVQIVHPPGLVGSLRKFWPRLIPPFLFPAYVIALLSLTSNRWILVGLILPAFVALDLFRMMPALRGEASWSYYFLSGFVSLLAIIVGIIAVGALIGL